MKKFIFFNNWKRKDQDAGFIGCKNVKHILSVKNLNPLQSFHLVILIKTNCSFLSPTLIYFDQKQITKLSTYKKLSMASTSYRLRKRYDMLMYYYVCSKADRS